MPAFKIDKIICVPQPDCYLCKNPVFREYDGLIFSRQENTDRTKERIYKEKNMVIGAFEIARHLTHLHLQSKLDESNAKKMLAKDKTLNDLSNIDSVDLVNAHINRIRLNLAELENTGQRASGQYFVMQKQLMELSKLKEELTGKLKTQPDIQIQILTDWKKKMNEVEKE